MSEACCGGSGTDLAPLDPGELARSLRPFGESSMLPRAAYTDPAVFAWEREHFFDGGWMCVGDAATIAKSGDRRAVSLGHGSALLVRGSDGVARAFANVCRHRGHELAPCDEEAVNQSVIVCPYHAWSYHLDGQLRKAPGFDRSVAFDPAEHGLTELPCAEWHGLLFTSLSSDPGPFAEHVDGLEELVAPYEVERLVVKASHDYVVASNWKVLAENYQECYHCSIIHPELCAASPPTSGENYHNPKGSWVGGWMDLREGFATMSLDGSTSGTPLRQLDERRRRIVDYIQIFPNLLLSLHPDYVMTHFLMPLSVDRTRIVCEWRFSPEDAARDDFDPAFAVDFWDITNREDWHACESVQRGLSNPRAIPGPQAPEEDGVYQLVSLVASGYAGGPRRAARVEVASV